ncbi:hypothetical protein CR513_35104, partial [Mucuna pruriens]
MRSGMELLQQQSLKMQYGFFGNLDSKNSTIVMGFTDSNSVSNSMLAVADSTKMTEIDDCVPTVSDVDNVIKIANFMTDVTDLTDMTLDEISDQVTRVEIVDPACVDVGITNPMCVNAKMADPRCANVDNAFADRAEDVDSLVDKLDSVNMTEMAESVVSMSDHANILEVSNYMMEVLSLADIIEVANSGRDQLGTPRPKPSVGESDSGEETNAESGMSIRLRVEGNSDDENRKQPEAESVSDNHVRWQEPIESDSSGQPRAESDSGSQSWNQPKVEIDLAHHLIQAKLDNQAIRQ